MYNDKVKSLLKQILPSDTDTSINQVKYKVEDNFSCLEFYISRQNVSFKVFGDPYLLAMAKWLQLSLNNKKDIDIDLAYLIQEFNIPDHKVKSAVQILEMIDNVNENRSIYLY